MASHRIDHVLDTLERAAPNGRVEDAALRAMLDFVRFDDDVEAQIWRFRAEGLTAKRALRRICQKVDERTRRAIVALIHPDVLSALPQRSEDVARVERDERIAVSRRAEQTSEIHDDNRDAAPPIETRASESGVSAVLGIAILVCIVIAIFVSFVR